MIDLSKIFEFAIKELQITVKAKYKSHISTQDWEDLRRSRFRQSLSWDKVESSVTNSEDGLAWIATDSDETYFCTYYALD